METYSAVGPRFVPGFGNRDHPRLAIVGEAPGREEEAKEEPFVGASGGLLNAILGKTGISRTECYLTNVCKIRPPNNDFGAFYKDKQRREPTDVLTESIRNLHQELKDVRPNLILALGAEPLRALCGKYGIDKWRGSVLPSPVGKVLPTYHPAGIFRVYEHLPVFQFDVRKAAREMQSPFLRNIQTKFVLQPSLEVTIDYIRSLKNVRRLAFDIETSGRYVRCLGLSGAHGHAICIPFTCSPITRGIVGSGTAIPVEVFGGTSSGDLYQYWSEREELLIIQELDKLFRSPVEKVAQNAPFDLSILADNFGLHVSNFVQDTMLAQHNCYIELPKGLDFLASIYTPYPYWSDYDPGSDLSTWTYNCYDATITLEVSEVLDTEMHELGVDEFYRHQYHDQIFAITRAETRGIKVDIAEKERRRVIVQSEVDQLITDLRTKHVTRTFDAKKGKKIVQEPFNPNSHVHMKEYLYGTLRLPQQTKRSKDGPKITSDKNALVALSRSYPHHKPLFDLLLAYSKAETLLGFLNRGVGDDGRIRTHYNLGGTDSRRLASSEPLFDPGTNLQNLPRGDFRRMFVADEGWSLIKADLSQAEFRLVVWMARIRRIIDLYMQHGATFDVHKWNAANNIFLVPIEAVTKEMRSTAKNGVYGGNYKMWYKKAAVVYGMPEATAKLVLDRYRQNVPEVPNVFWPETEAMINGPGKIISPLGSLRIFFGRRDDDTYRAAYSYRAQEVVSGIVNRAFALGDEIMAPQECHPLLQAHDEIVFHCRDDCVAKYVPVVRNVLQYPIKFPGVPEPLVIPAEVSVGKNWFDQKEVLA